MKYLKILLPLLFLCVFTWTLLPSSAYSTAWNFGAATTPTATPTPTPSVPCALATTGVTMNYAAGCTGGSALQAGDLMIMHSEQVNAIGNPGTVGGWLYINSGGNGDDLYSWMRIFQTGDTSVTFSAGSSAGALCFMAVRGWSNVDVQPAAIPPIQLVGGGNNLVIPSYTTTGTNDALIGLWTWNRVASSAVSVNNGFTIEASQTSSASVNGCANAFALKGTAGATGTTTLTLSGSPSASSEAGMALLP